MPLPSVFQLFCYIVVVSFIDGENQSTWKKPLTNLSMCRNQIHYFSRGPTDCVANFNSNYHTIASKVTTKNYYINSIQSVRKVMDVNEYERLSNITHKTQNEAKEHHFYCCSTFHSYSRVFNNESNSYTNKMSVKQTLAYSWAVFNNCLEYVWLLKWAIFQLYYGENKLHFNEMMIMFIFHFVLTRSTLWAGFL